jgi:uncharacterized protein YjbI with pentapeptide repeats
MLGMKKNFFAIAVITTASTIAFSAPANAGIMFNGIGLNGITLNGINLNGIELHKSSLYLQSQNRGVVLQNIRVENGQLVALRSTQNLVSN